MIIKSKKSRKVTITIKEPKRKSKLNNKDIFINKILGLNEKHIAVGADKSASLSLSSRLNVKKSKNMLRRLNKLSKVVNYIRNSKTKMNVIKLLRDSKYLRKHTNKIKKAVNGNINHVKKVIKVLGWNKGSFDLSTKIDEIKTILKQKKPDIFIINELNLYKNYDINMCSAEGYNFEHDNLYKSRGVARTGMYIASNFNYERIKKCELNGESIVAIKIGYPNTKKLNIIGFYRQWSKTFCNKPFEKYSIPQQETNFENQMAKIKEFSNTETIIMGDFNIDYHIFDKSEDQKINYEKNFKKRLITIKENLLSSNFNQLIKTNTHAHKILDHIYYNNMIKLHRAYVDEDSSSDHKFIIIEKK